MIASTCATAGASEGFHGEPKTWHGLARAVRRGLHNMRIQAFLTAAAINLKGLAAANAVLLLQSLLFVGRKCRSRDIVIQACERRRPDPLTECSPEPTTAFFNSPRIH